MSARIVFPVLVALVLGACNGSAAPTSPGVRASPAAPDSSVLTITVPPVPGADCRTDAECGPGKVCAGCGDGRMECVTGCNSAADCPAGESCVQVQCVRCPCPAQCMKR